MSRRTNLDSIQYVAELLSQTHEGLIVSDFVTDGLKKHQVSRILDKYCAAGHAEKRMEARADGGPRARYFTLEGHSDFLEDVATSKVAAAKFLESTFAGAVGDIGAEDEAGDEIAPPPEDDLISRHLVLVVQVMESHTTAINELKQQMEELVAGNEQDAVLLTRKVDGFGEVLASVMAGVSELVDYAKLRNTVQHLQAKHLGELTELVAAQGQALAAQARQLEELKQLALVQTAMASREVALDLRAAQQTLVRIVSQEKSEESEPPSDMAFAADMPAPVDPPRRRAHLRSVLAPARLSALPQVVAMALDPGFGTAALLPKSMAATAPAAYSEVSFTLVKPEKGGSTK